MPTEVRFTGPRAVDLHRYPDRPLSPREVRCQVLYSGISHGTEMSHYRGDAIWLHKQVEPDGFLTDGCSMVYPYPYGYEDVVRITEIGDAVTEVGVGDAVYAWVGHRDVAIIDMDQANRGDQVSSFERLPSTGRLEDFVFVSLGTVAYEAVLLGPVRLGESVVVLGQGVLGLLAMQLCKLAGAHPVIVADPLPARLDMAHRLGADHVLDASTDLGPQVRRLLGGHGADLVLECSGRVRALGQALRCGVPFPKVVALGMYDEPGSDLRLAEEFCRSGGQILHSRSGGFRLPPDGLGDRAFRKWSFARINAAVIRLIHIGELRVDGLITHRFPLEQAGEAYQLIDTHPERVVQVIFDLTQNAAA